MKWIESLNTIIRQFTTEILIRRRIATQVVWRVRANRDSLWNLERNDDFPTKKTLNQFYAWTIRGPINKGTQHFLTKLFNLGSQNQ